MAEMKEALTERAKGSLQRMGEAARSTGTQMMDTAKDKVASGASGIGEKMRDTAQEWANCAGDAAGQAMTKSQQMASAAAEMATEMGGEFNNFVRRHPLPSILGGIGLGFLIAQAVKRS